MDLMNLNDILSKLEHDFLALKEKVSAADYSQLEERYQQLKEFVSDVSTTLSETIQEKLSDPNVNAKIEDSKLRINHALQDFSLFIKEINEKYNISNTVEESIHALRANLLDVYSQLKSSYGQQIQSTVEALSHGFKAWVDAKPLDQDIQTIKTNVETQIKSLKAWIRKD